MAETLRLFASTPADLPECARRLIDFAGDIRVWLFYGAMGIGKTTFINSICKVLGISDTTSSPTFALVNEYGGNGRTVYHFDLYRIRDQQEALDFGIEEYFGSGNYCLIEWPEKIPDLLPEQALAIHMNELDQGAREVTANKFKSD